MKKEKNVPVQIPLVDILSQFSNPQYISRFKNDPQELANQIDDLKTIIKFSMTSFQQKSKSVIKKINQYSKGLNASRMSLKKYIDNLQIKVNSFSSNQKFAYEILKKTSKPIIQQAEYTIDCRKIFTQMKLKYLQSEGLNLSLNGSDWNQMYNSIQRCLDIGREAFTLIKVGLRIEKGKFLWKIIKILYNQNQNNLLDHYYKEELIVWMTKKYPDQSQRQNKMLSLLLRSVNYTPVILLYMTIKQLQVNRNISQRDQENFTFRIFQQKSVENEFSQLKIKQSLSFSNSIKQESQQINEQNLNLGKNLSSSIKIHFNLVYSQQFPSIQVFLNQKLLLIVEFNQTQIKINIKISSHKYNFQTILSGKVKNIVFSISLLKSLILQSINLNETFFKFYQLVQSMDSEFYAIQNIKLLARISEFSKTAFVSKNVNQKNIQNIFQTKQNGLYLIHNITLANEDQANYLLIKISSNSQLSCRMIESGYINKLLKRPGIKFIEAMMHIQLQKYFLSKNWEWDFKLYNVNCTKDKQYIHYIFQQLNYSKSLYKNQNKLDIGFHQQRKKEGNSSITINIKISSNFQKLKVFCSKQISPEQQIEQKYFTKEWMQIKKECQQKGKYLPIKELSRTLYHILNHFLFDRVFNQPNMNDTRNLYKIELMTQ